MLDLLRLKMPAGKAMLEVVVPWLTDDLACWLTRCTASDAAVPKSGPEAEFICKELLSLCRSLCNLLILAKRPGLIWGVDCRTPAEYALIEFVWLRGDLGQACFSPCAGPR